LHLKGEIKMKKVTVEDLQGIKYKDLAVDSPEFRASLSEPFAQIVRDGLNEESIARKVLRVVPYESNPEVYEEDSRKVIGVYPIQKYASAPALSLEAYDKKLIQCATLPCISFADIMNPNTMNTSVIEVAEKAKNSFIKQENIDLIRRLKDGTESSELSTEIKVGFNFHKSCIMNENAYSRVSLWDLPKNIYFTEECEENMIYLLGSPEEIGELRIGFDVICFSESSVAKIRVGWVFAEGLVYNLNFCTQFIIQPFYNTTVGDIVYLTPDTNNKHIFTQICNATAIKII
jgi:hypothetical protein